VSRAFDRVTLETGRLVLRPLREDDAAALFAMFSDPRVVRYTSTPPWESIDVAHQRIADDRRELAAGEHLRLGVVLRDGGPIVGTCSVYQLHEESRRAELGYALAVHAQGRGLMHEALTAVLDWAFGPLELHRVEADADPRNAPSVRTLERLGFAREGLLRERWIVAGEVQDSVMYGLLAREWQARRTR